MTSKKTSTQYREHMGLIMSFSQKGTEVKISVKNGNAFSMRNETKSSVLYYPLLFHPEKEKIPACKFGNKSLFVCSCQQCLCKAGRIYCCVFTHWRKNIMKKKMKYKSNESYLAVPSRSRIFGFISCLDDVNWPP